MSSRSRVVSVNTKDKAVRLCNAIFDEFGVESTITHMKTGPGDYSLWVPKEDMTSAVILYSSGFIKGYEAAH